MLLLLEILNYFFIFKKKIYFILEYSIFLGSKITVDGDYSLEIKRCLLLGRKAVTNIDSILKSRETPLLTNGCIVKAKSYVFSSIHVWVWELDHKES